MGLLDATLESLGNSPVLQQVLGCWLCSWSEAFTVPMILESIDMFEPPGEHPKGIAYWAPP